MAKNEKESTEYWSIDFYGLDEPRAKQMATFAAEEIDPPMESNIRDPRYSYTRGMDRSSVEMVVAALTVALDAGHLSERNRIGILSTREDMIDWLDQAAEVDND